MNPAEFLTISSAVLPDRDALVAADGGKRITYAEMASRVNRLATALRDQYGVASGSRVAVIAVNSPESVEIYYACAKLGACFVPLNPRARRDELVYMLDTAGVSVVFANDRYTESVASIKAELPAIEHHVSLEGGSAGLPSYEGLLASGADEDIFTDIEEGDPTVLIYTSGTTALPKGVYLTYLNLSVYVMNTMSPADPDSPHDKTLLSVGVFHVAGMTAILSSIWGGRTLVILPQFEPKLWLETVQREGVTHSFVVPTMLKRIMEHPDFPSYDLSSLQLITYGAAPMPYDVVRKAVEVFNCGLMNAYGQTESTSSLTYLGPEDHRLDGTPEENERKLKRLRSVGRAMDDVALAIMSGTGEPLPSGQEGEICVQSARVMKEYIHAAAATAEAVHDGWLHTGDVGYIDEDGYLFITGRVKDLIIRGGENISAGEIEAVLESHPAVEEAAVIGVADNDWGEVVKAVVVTKTNPGVSLDELVAYTKERLASYKAPAYVAFIDELPRNPMGKVLKTELRRFHGEPDNN